MKRGDIVEVYDVQTWSATGAPVFAWFRDREVLSVNEHTIVVGAPGMASNGQSFTMGCQREYHCFAVRAQQ
jgi:hypothetical protein